MATVESFVSGKIIEAAEAPIPTRERNLYDEWASSLGIPVHRAFYVEDVRDLELGWWEERQCNGAIVDLVGQEGVVDVKVTEVPPGKTTAPSKMALDEGIYVVDGRGLTTVWAEGQPKKTVEWSKHSMFLIPRNHYYQLTNTQGDRPTRMVHFSYLSMAMPLVGDPDILFKSSSVDLDLLYSEGGFYSAAQALTRNDDGNSRRSYVWSGNFFPDLHSWDNLKDHSWRGGGKNVAFMFPKSPITAHMSVFPGGSYKKAHRHNAGATIVVPAGEGYSLLWLEKGGDMILTRWREGSLLVPPHRWWHQHFNVGSKEPARYMAFHPPKVLPGRGEIITNVELDQIEYTDESPAVRQLFQEELAKRGMKSIMPDKAYQDKDFEFTLM